MTNEIGPAFKSASSNAGQPITVPSSVLADPRRTLPPGYIHLGVAKEIVPTLRDFGIEPDPVIREAGLDPRLFEDGSQRHPPCGPGSAAHPVRGPHALPAFRAAGRPARHDPVAGHGRAPDAAFGHRGRCHAGAGGQPEHPEPRLPSRP